MEKRIAYLMAQACCESADLVEKPSHWVGMNAVDAVCRGTEMTGLYLTAELRRQAVREGKSVTQMYSNSPSAGAAQMFVSPKCVDDRVPCQLWIG